MRLSATIHAEADGGYWAEVSALARCVTQGDTLEDLAWNLEEAVEGYLLSAADCGCGRPAPPRRR